MNLVALVVVLGLPQIPDPAVPLRRAAIDALESSGYAVPTAVPPEHSARADFDASGYEDWAVLVKAGSKGAAILVAYQFQNHWRAGNIDVWDSTPGPVRIEMLPPGKYTRVPPYSRAREPNEREQVNSGLPGVLVTFADGRRRAYQLGPHAWHYVYLGLSRGGAGEPPNKALELTKHCRRRGRCGSFAAQRQCSADN